MAANVIADACGEVPSVEVTAKQLLRMRNVDYWERSGAIFRDLGISPEEAQKLATAAPNDLASALKRAADDNGWAAEPERHLLKAGCRLAICVLENANADPILRGMFPDPLPILNWYAERKLQIRAYVGVDPRDKNTIAEGFGLQSHRAFAGLALSPFLIGQPLTDPMYAPVLKEAAQRGIPIWVHSSAHFRKNVPYDVSHPRYTDAILSRYRTLRILIGHAGWPWTLESVIIGLRHANVAIEFSTFPPTAIRRPGMQLGALLDYQTALRGRIFFGSGRVTSTSHYARLVAGLDSLALGDDAGLWKGVGLMEWLGLS